MNVFDAIEAGDLEEVKSFLEKRGNIDLEIPGGQNLLCEAISRNQLEIMKFLIDRGADVNTKTNADRTPLMFACKIGSLEMVEVLLQKGADVNVVSRFRKVSATHIALEREHFKIAKRLFANGATFTSSLEDAFYNFFFPPFLLVVKEKSDFSEEDRKFLSELKLRANLGKYAL